MTTKRKNASKRQGRKVDPVDVLSAIADIVEYMRRRHISISDLAVRVGWTNSDTEYFLFDGDIPSYEDLVLVSKELNLKLDF